jgi:multiple sugar transport system permease protein
MNTTKKIDVSIFLKQIILIMGSVVMVIPFLWMILTSFKTLVETNHIPMIWLPSKFNFDNYFEVLDKLSFGKYYLNTIFITLSITLGQVFICSLAAYSFARLNFPGRNKIFFLLLCVLMIPSQMIIIPQYLLMVGFKWLNTYLALIIPNLPSAYGTFFLRQFFLTLPKELEDSAKIDGCSYFRTYWKIMLPLCSNALIAFTIFTVLWAWNDLLWPLIVTSKDSMRVLPVGIATLCGQYVTDYNLLMAASVMAILPMVVMYIFGQKYFISGIALTGIKA